MPDGSLHAFVVPAFGQAVGLERCLASLRGQTSSGSELIVATSTPSPSIELAAQRHGAEYRVSPLQGGGIAADWNFALRCTTRRFVTLAHQDDVYAPEYVAALLARLRRGPAGLLAFCDYREHTPDGPRPRHLNLSIKRWLVSTSFLGRRWIHTRRAKRRLLALGNPICCSSVMLDRQHCPDFVFRGGLRSNLDWAAWLELADRPGAFAFEPRALVSKGIHLASETTALLANRVREQEDLAMFQRQWPQWVARALARAYRCGYAANQT